MSMSLSPRPEMFTMKTSPGVNGRAADGFRHGVRGFERGNDAFGAAQSCRGFDGVLVAAGAVFGASAIVQPGVLGSDRGVVETRGDGVRGGDLAVLVLQNVAARAVKDSGESAGEARGVLAGSVAASAGFDADELHAFVFHERMEDADGVAAASDAGEDGVGQAAFDFENLAAGFEADDAMEVAHHGGIRVRAERRAEQIVGGGDVGDPVAHGFADGVFEGAAAVGHADDVRAEQAHAEDVEALAAHVFLAHVDRTIEPKQGADGGGGDAVLAGAGFGDDAALAHAAGEERLAEAVVDLVRAGVEQVFALEIDLRAEVLREAAGEVERRGTSGVGGEEFVQFLVEGRVFASFVVSELKFFERGHQHFGGVTAAVSSEVPACVGLRSHG